MEYKIKIRYIIQADLLASHTTPKIVCRGWWKKNKHDTLFLYKLDYSK